MRLDRKSLIAGWALLTIALAGCGSSSHRSTTASTTPSIGTAAPATTTAKPPSTSPASTPAASTPHTTTTGASNVRLPAEFTIRSAGSLSPPSVTAPSGVTIALTVVSGDGKAHRVVIRTPRREMLSVPAGGRASTLLTEVPAGHYTLTVDGVTSGTLVVGGQPGP